MEMTQAGIALIKSFEGFSATPYNDGNGHMTIGYGHEIKSGESFTHITQEAATALLMEDMIDAETSVLNFLTVPLTDNQYSAVVSLIFNEGTAPLHGHFGGYLNDAEFDTAANEFGKWVYESGKIVNGLVRRRAAERALFIS